MTEEKLKNYYAVYGKVKNLKLNIKGLINQIDSLNDKEMPMVLPVNLSGVCLIPSIGEKVLYLALELCEQELIKAQEEFDEL